MAHNLNYNEQLGRHSFFSVKEKPWHELGAIVENRLTSAEAIKAGGLDWDVIKTPNYANINGVWVQTPGSFSTVRQDTGKILGDKIGQSYHVIQNSSAFSFFDSITGNTEAIYETAGCLHDGQVVFITAKLPDYIRVGKDDLIEKYIFLMNSHDGSSVITGGLTPIRIVCNNTLNAALRNMQNVIKIRHTVSADSRLKQAHQLMGISNQYAQDLQDAFNRMAKKPFMDNQLKELVLQSFASQKNLDKMAEQEEVTSILKNITDRVMAYAGSAESQQMTTTRGTVFGAYNAITGYFQNVKHYETPDSKFESILFGGQGERVTQKAFNLCLEAIKN